MLLIKRKTEARAPLSPVTGLCPGLSEHLDVARDKTSGSSLAAWGHPVKPPLQAGPSASQRGRRGGKEGRGRMGRQTEEFY